MIEARTQPTGAYISYTTFFFRTIFLLNNYSRRDPIYIRPRFFYFRDPLSRLTFATPFRDSHSRPTFATYFRDSCSRLHSRLPFTTRVRDHTRDSRSRCPIALPTVTRYFLSRLPSCDSTTDGQTVLTPQCHLPSVPTLTLIKIWNLLPGLASTTSYHPPSCPPPPPPPSGFVFPDTPFGPTPPPEASTPPARPPSDIPTFITPPEPPSIPPVWEHAIDVLMKLPTTTAEGQNMRSWVTFHSLTSLEDFLMWELDTLQYDAITVCFPSGDTTSPNSLVSLKPNSIRHLIMLRKYIHHLVQDSHISVSSDASDHALEPDNFLHTTFHQYMSWKLNEITTSSLIQFPPEMDENWVRYGLAKLGQISKLPNWQRMLFCAYTTQLLHSTGEVCWNNNDSYFIWFEFVCRNSGQIASRRSWKRSCFGLEYTSKCSRLALLWEPN